MADATASDCCTCCGVVAENTLATADARFELGCAGGADGTEPEVLAGTTPTLPLEPATVVIAVAALMEVSFFLAAATASSSESDDEPMSEYDASLSSEITTPARGLVATCPCLESAAATVAAVELATGAAGFVLPTITFETAWASELGVAAAAPNFADAEVAVAENERLLSSSDKTL